jgi:hypothetical protein
MPIVRRTDCIKPRVVLAWMYWLRLCGARTRAERTVWILAWYTSIHTVRSARVPTPHNRSQYIQANTTLCFIQSVLLTMGIMMPESCWVNLLWIIICNCVICWFFLLLWKYTFTSFLIFVVFLNTLALVHSLIITAPTAVTVFVNSDLWRKSWF